MTRLGVVLSGRGSNFEAIAEQIGQDKLGAEIAVVVSNRAEAPGLDAARRLGLSAVALPSRGVERPEYDRSLIAVLRAHDVEWVILAGYMRILTADFIRAFPERILNIHPSLLPAFPGLDAQHQAFAYGVKVTGCTVHFVDEHLDHGPIVMQATVPVDDGDTVETLSARILREEHRIYSEALRLLLAGGWRIEGRKVIGAMGLPAGG
ncbi:MAG: phosphoribosylglycinamide formyltransferase [Acidobacteria bacterium]|nr:phosphoribosylglycinamide formyltransferase [Acidobacteriota bacterium]